MEVRDESVGNLELIRWVDELICPTLVWLYDTACEHARFESAHHAATNCIDITLGLQRLVDHVCRVLCDLEVFAIHAMLSKIFYFDSLENPLPDIQLDSSDLYTLLLRSL